MMNFSKRVVIQHTCIKHTRIKLKSEKCNWILAISPPFICWEWSWITHWCKSRSDGECRIEIFGAILISQTNFARYEFFSSPDFLSSDNGQKAMHMSPQCIGVLNKTINSEHLCQRKPFPHSFNDLFMRMYRDHSIFRMDLVGLRRQGVRILRGMKNPYTLKYHIVSVFHYIILSF